LVETLVVRISAQEAPAIVPGDQRRPWLVGIVDKNAARMDASQHSSAEWLVRWRLDQGPYRTVRVAGQFVHRVSVLSMRLAGKSAAIHHQGRTGDE
jgi:hypothetical protein